MTHPVHKVMGHVIKICVVLIHWRRGTLSYSVRMGSVRMGVGWGVGSEVVEWWMWKRRSGRMAEDERGNTDGGRGRRKREGEGQLVT